MQIPENRQPLLDTWRDVEAAFERADVVTGTVIALVKGGYRVALSAFEAFLPATQIALHPLRELDATYIGQRLEFHILKLDASRLSIVLSRLAVLKEAQTRRVAELRVGAVLEGQVVRVIDESVFVDLGGVDGRLHLKFLPDIPGLGGPARLVPGQKLWVQILKIVAEKPRITLRLPESPDAPPLHS
jgi:small subunit ribosomal protein S1